MNDAHINFPGLLWCDGLVLDWPLPLSYVSRGAEERHRENSPYQDISFRTIMSRVGHPRNDPRGDSE